MPMNYILFSQGMRLHVRTGAVAAILGPGGEIPKENVLSMAMLSMMEPGSFTMSLTY